MKGYTPLHTDDEGSQAERRRHDIYGDSWTFRALLLIAIFSAVGNAIWAYSTFQATKIEATNKDQSLYARLERDIPTPYRDDTLFAHHNRTIADAAWESWVVDPGIVALPHDWVKGRMLPQAQHWPWDGNKGVYLLNGYHNLHCLQYIRRSLLRAINNEPIDIDPEEGLEHNLHCLESLRQDTVCNADDTPRYSGFSKKNVAGVMQTRMCRSWDKLEDWARSHTACYRDIGRETKGFPEIEKYKFCPEGYVFRATGSPTPPWMTGNGAAQPGEE